MFHRHIESFPKQGILYIRVATRSDNGLRATSMVKAVLALLFKSFLTCVENYCILHVLVTRLIKSARSWSFVCLLILTWSRNIEFQTLTEECLVEMESRWSCIEANFFTDHNLVIRGPCLLLPITFLISMSSLTSSTIIKSSTCKTNVPSLFILHGHFLPRVLITR